MSSVDSQSEFSTTQRFMHIRSDAPPIDKRLLEPCHIIAVPHLRAALAERAKVLIPNFAPARRIALSNGAVALGDGDVALL